MSETCPVVTIANLKEHMLDWDVDKKVDVLIKTGLPLPLAEMKVVDAQGKELPHDGKSTGELVMRVPYLTEATSRTRRRRRSCGETGGCTVEMSRTSMKKDTYRLPTG